ncbi:hypothetical protein IW150_006872, partial [Coemansia sp. RSA 2607]
MLTRSASNKNRSQKKKLEKDILKSPSKANKPKSKQKPKFQQNPKRNSVKRASARQSTAEPSKDTA